jgi:hypothetical protein
MTRRSWTELFFLDEATALAAGHRPCFLCRRQDAMLFRGIWAEVLGPPHISAHEMDAALHQERLDGGRKRLSTLDVPTGGLPDGAMVAAAGAAFIILNGQAFLWTFDGYQISAFPSQVDGLLTPPSTLAVLRGGYRPVLHPTAYSLSKTDECDDKRLV